MSEVINSGQVIKKPDLVIDNNFFLPPDVIDMREKGETDNKNRNEDLDGLTDIDQTLSIVDETADGNAEQTIESPVSLQAPGWITIYSQSIRFTPDGSQVVDVTLEVEDIEGVNQYDVRVTKA